LLRRVEMLIRGVGAGDAKLEMRGGFKRRFGMEGAAVCQHLNALG
jgi:hypothetical protein